jgi:hypothetical protein
MPKISLMIHTASFDDFLNDHQINSYFEALVNNLEFQIFKDFELVYIDTFYEENKEKFAAIKSNFQIKHVPVHLNHRYWFDKGYCYISAAKNTGIIYSDGELLVTCDDSEFFPESFLQKYWDHYKSGFYMHAVHKRMKSIEAENGVPKNPINGDIYINDYRILNDPREIIQHRHGNWLYAGTSVSLGDALTLNGFNEKMDSCKSLEDCEFGARLVLAGRSFVADKEGFAYILDHKSYSEFKQIQWNEEDRSNEENKPVYCKKKIDNLIAVENYGVLKASEELFEIKANRKNFGPKHMQIIQRETLKYRNFDPLAIENKEKLDLWLGTPNFSLENERKEIRLNADWKW